MTRRPIQSLDPVATRAKQKLLKETRETLDETSRRALGELVSSRGLPRVSKKEEKTLTELGIQIESDEKLNKK